MCIERFSVLIIINDNIHGHFYDRLRSVFFQINSNIWGCAVSDKFLFHLEIFEKCDAYAHVAFLPVITVMCSQSAYIFVLYYYNALQCNENRIFFFFKYLSGNPVHVCIYVAFFLHFLSRDRLISCQQIKSPPFPVKEKKN